MKYRLALVSLLFSLFSLFPAMAKGTESGHLPSPSAITDSGYKVENLSADIFVGGTILIVKAEVRNLRTTPVKGYVIVHLQNENREDIGTVETEVNKNAYFQPGSTGQLEVVINIDKFPNVKNASIEFVSN